MVRALCLLLPKNKPGQVYQYGYSYTGIECVVEDPQETGNNRTLSLSKEMKEWESELRFTYCINVCS